MTVLSSDNPALDAILARLPAGLRQHLARARGKALELAALSHDIARDMKETELFEIAVSP